MMLAWDQCASTFDNSPVSATLERVAARWVLDALDLPRDSAVGSGTSATACTLTALAAARREAAGTPWLGLRRPRVERRAGNRVLISELAHHGQEGIARAGLRHEHDHSCPGRCAGRVDAADCRRWMNAPSSACKRAR
ncbi:hypothetical protein M8494_23165 [Serratia ureilytica]